MNWKVLHAHHNIRMRFARSLSALIAAMVLFSIFRLVWMLSNNTTKFNNDVGKPGVTRDSKHIQQMTNRSKYLCGRKLNIDGKNINLATKQSSPHHGIKQIVIIGHDNMHHVQTNNHINALLHATDYAFDHHAELAISRNGWATDVLQLFFGGDHNMNHEEEWEREIEKHLGVRFLDQSGISKMVLDPTSEYNSIAYMSGDEMYYYHSTSNVSTILERRKPILQYLWTHVTRLKHDMCSAIFNTLPEKYVVIHSRWMKKDGCLKRLGRLAKRVKHETGITIDGKASCNLKPSYIKSILLSSNHSGTPVFIISDGKNPNITKALKTYPTLNVQDVPDAFSWVGGDMVLGILSSIFIGTPVSTLSGNIARARAALGFNPNSNFMFPHKRKGNDDDWKFTCEDGHCLYDTRFLSNYVG